MRMQYVLKPFALSALALGLLIVGAPAVQAAQDGDAPQGYKQRGDRDSRHADDRGGRHYDRKDGQDRYNDRQERHDDRHNDRMDRRHDNRSDQGDRMGKPQYDKDKGDRRNDRMDRRHDNRSDQGDRMGKPQYDKDRGDRRSQGDGQQRGPQGGQRPADNDNDVRN